jgi:hypothetical protein
MNQYKIKVNAISNLYEGESKEDALNRYAKDAGYQDFEDLQEQHPEDVTITRI